VQLIQMQSSKPLNISNKTSRGLSKEDYAHIPKMRRAMRTRLHARAPWGF